MATIFSLIQYYSVPRLVYIPASAPGSLVRHGDITFSAEMADELMKGMSQISIDDNNENRGKLRPIWLRFHTSFHLYRDTFASAAFWFAQFDPFRKWAE